MNEQLETTINDILIKAMEGLNKGADWLAGEIPDVVSQLLIWNATSAIIWGLFWAALIAGYLMNVKRLIAMSSDERNIERSMAGILGLAGGGALTVIGVFCVMIYLEIALKIWVAPKLYLLEYAADLVK